MKTHPSQGVAVKLYRMMFTIIVALMVMAIGACADSPTAPRERAAVALWSDTRVLYMDMNTYTHISVRSTVIGRNSVNDADSIIVRMDNKSLTSLVEHQGQYLEKILVGGTSKETVVHYQFIRITAKETPGDSWIYYRSRIDPTQKDSIRVVVSTFDGGKG